MQDSLDERKKRVLHIIVEDYIDSAEPVASKAITRKHHLEASPATIRIDMGELEKKGYILKPHTSAGRVPSDKGYRFFLDNLMRAEQITQKEIEAVREKLTGLSHEELVNAVTDILSAMSGNASVVISSDKHGDFHISGISKLIRQPEFNVSEKICRVVETLEDRPLISEVLEEYIDGNDSISFRIGEENDLKQFRNCSVAAAVFKDSGILSVIGPTRMDYGRVSKVLRSFADILEEFEI